MPASQVKGVANVIMISETKLEHTILLSLTFARKIGLYIVLATPTKTTYPHIWKSSDKLRIFNPLIMIILLFTGISMQMLAIKQCLTFVNLTI